MMLYTIILEFKGGTYIEQIRAADEVEAITLWVKKVSGERVIENLDWEKFLRDYEGEIAEFPPTPIDGRPNVWYMSFFFGRRFMPIHIIGTADVSTEKKHPQSLQIIAEKRLPELAAA